MLINDEKLHRCALLRRRPCTASQWTTVGTTLIQDDPQAFAILQRPCYSMAIYDERKIEKDMNSEYNIKHY